MSIDGQLLFAIVILGGSLLFSIYLLTEKYSCKPTPCAVCHEPTSCAVCHEPTPCAVSSKPTSCAVCHEPTPDPISTSGSDHSSDTLSSLSISTPNLDIVNIGDIIDKISANCCGEINYSCKMGSLEVPDKCSKNCSKVFLKNFPYLSNLQHRLPPNSWKQLEDFNAKCQKINQ